MPTLTFKVSDADADAIRRAAREKRVNLSEFLRESATAQIPAQEGTGQFLPKRHPVSGLWYNAAPNQPQYTHAELKKFLEDFP